MTARSFEDFAAGERWESAAVEITAEAIIAFGRANDPQPMHCDPEAATAGRFGGLIASGWQIAALSTRLFVEAGGGYGETPVVGMGIDQLRWRKPVRPGDRLHVVRQVAETQLSRSNPRYGIIRTDVSVINQHGEAVLTMVAIGQVPTREA